MRHASAAAVLALVISTILSAIAALAAPSDLTIFKTTDLAFAVTKQNEPAPSRRVAPSQLAAPSVATDGTTILLTYDGASVVSSDAGVTFMINDARQVLPTDGGLPCCSQRVLYEPSRGLFFWAIEYGPAPYFVRLAAATPTLAARGKWAYWEFHAADVKGFTPEWGIGYPQIAAGSNYLYLTVLAAPTSPPPSTCHGCPKGAAGIIRLALDELAQGAPTPKFATFASPTATETSLEVITPVQGASATMYFGQNVSTTALDLISWPESGSASTARIGHTQTVSGLSICTGPNGRNLCTFIDDRLQSGWLSSGAIGFAWTGGAGGTAGRPYPYVQMIRIDEATRAVIEQPTLEDSSNALILPSASVNARGDLAVIATTVGRTVVPTVIAFVRDDISGPTQWTRLTLRTSALSPPLDGWGDYQTVVPSSPSANSWVAATWTMQPPPYSGVGPTPDPQALVTPESQLSLITFGRERDAPGASPSVIATPTASPTPTATPASSPPAVSPSPSPSPPPSTPSTGRCATSAGPVGQRVAAFWRCVDGLSASDNLLAEDLGQWARNVIELDPAACISVGDFRSSAATMQGAMDTASAGIPAAPPKSADVEARIGAFWKKVDALGPLDFLAATDLGQWALNVIDRDPSRRIRVDDFRASTAGMQSAFDRAKASGAVCKAAAALAAPFTSL